MAVTYFTGFETGDGLEITTLGSGASVQSSTVLTGGYSLKQGSTASTPVTGLGTTTGCLRFRVSIPSLPGTDVEILSFGNTSGAIMRLRVKGSGSVLEVYQGSQATGITTTDGTTVLAANTPYCIAAAMDVAAGGIIRVWLNGNLEIDITHSATGTTLDRFSFFGQASPNESFFDDVLFDNTLSQLMDGRHIVRQGKSGTPTYNNWTKTSGQTIDQVWNATPFSATNNAAATAANAQTMFVFSFSAVQSGHGTEIILPQDNINACKVAHVGKRGSGGATTHKLRRRLGGADTDSNDWTGISTVDQYKDTMTLGGVFTATLADLNGAEIGGVQGGTGQLWTIEDAWLMVDYTTTILPKAAMAPYVPA